MFCFSFVSCLNRPLLQPAEDVHGLYLTVIDFCSHSPSCAISTLSLCLLEESRSVSGIAEHHLEAGSVSTQLLTHTPCPVHLWCVKLPPFHWAPCPEASARFPAILTDCGSRSHTRCCTWYHQCHRLALCSLGKLPRLSHPHQHH